MERPCAKSPDAVGVCVAVFVVAVCAPPGLAVCDFEAAVPASVTACELGLVGAGTPIDGGGGANRRA